MWAEQFCTISLDLSRTRGYKGYIECGGGGGGQKGASKLRGHFLA